MLTVIKTFRTDTHILKIISDDHIESPREWDNLSQMIFFGKHKGLGDEHNIEFEVSFNDRQDFNTRGAEILKKQLNAAIVVPVNMYSHSGETISLSNDYPYNDRWDSGTVGFAVVTKEAIYKEFSTKRITKGFIGKAMNTLKCEVEVLDQYITGDVVGFKLETNEGEEVDSCWGFYGSDPKENGILAYISDEKMRAKILEN